MAVRFTAAGQHYTRALGLGSRTALTVCAWVKLGTDLDAIATLMTIDNGTGDYFALRTAANGTTMRAMTDAGVHATRPMTVGKWYFVAMTASNTGGMLMTKALDEADYTVSTWSATHATNAANLRIGVWAGGGTYFPGSVAGLRIWTTAMSEVELEAESYGFAPSRLADLVAFYRFVKPSTTDDSGNGHTLSGGAGASAEPDPPMGVTSTISEGFETATPAFTMTGDWERTTDEANAGGSWSLRSSATITDNDVSDVEVIAPPGATTVSFAYRVSSEPTYDHFDVFVDGTAVMAAQSGEVPWTQAGPVPVRPGSIVRFSYSKDVNGRNGADAAFIDDITFTVADPPMRFNVFDGGTAGAPLTPANSGGASGDAIDLVVGSPAFSNAIPHRDGLVVTNAVAGSDTHIDWTGITQPGDTICARLYLYRAGSPVDVGGVFALIGPDGVVSKVWMYPDGTIDIYTGAVDNLAVSGTIPIPIGQWVRLEWRYTIDALGNGTVEQWTYLAADSSAHDDYVISSTWAWPGGKPADAEFHLLRDATSQCYVDEIAVADVKIGSTFPQVTAPVWVNIETDTAQPITGRKIRSVGQVTSTDEAHPVRPGKRRAVGQPVEADAAAAVRGRRIRPIGQVMEGDSAGRVTTARARSVGQVVETSSAVAITPDAGNMLVRVLETDAARRVRPAKVAHVGQVTESASAAHVAAAHRIPIAHVVETSAAAELRGAKSRRVEAVAEADTATRVDTGVLRRVTESDAAMPITAVKYRRRPMRAGRPRVAWQARSPRTPWAAGRPHTRWSAGSPRT